MAKRGNSPRRSNPPQSGRVLTRQQQTTLTYHGPIPPPEVLRGIEEIVPGGAERIIAMAEENQRARIAREGRFDQVAATMADGMLASRRRSSWMGYSLSIAVCLLSALFAILGMQATAIAGFVFAMASFSAASIWGRWRELKGQKDSPGTS